MKSFVRQMEDLEKQDAVLNVWLAHGFEYGDVPFIGVRMVVVTDNSPALADDIAEKMGRKFYEMRNEALSVPDTMNNCLDKAVACKKRSRLPSQILPTTPVAERPRILRFS